MWRSDSFCEKTKTHKVVYRKDEMWSVWFQNIFSACDAETQAQTYPKLEKTKYSEFIRGQDMKKSADALLSGSDLDV